MERWKAVRFDQRDQISDQRPENIEADMGGLQSLLLAILGRCTHGNQLEGTSLLFKM